MKLSFEYPYRFCCSKCKVELDDPQDVVLCPPVEDDWKNHTVEVELFCLDCDPHHKPWLRMSEVFPRYSYYSALDRRKMKATG